MSENKKPDPARGITGLSSNPPAAGFRGLVTVFEVFQSCLGQVMTVFEAFQKGMKHGRAEVRGRRGRERNEERWKMNRWEEQKSKRPPS